MKKNERLQALRILIQVMEDQTPLLYAIKAIPDLSPLSKTLCFGVCRHYARLQALADYWLTKRPKHIDVWLCLLMGLYQLHYLRTPDYAVVKETVNLLALVKKSWAKGLVNAVLRRYCREHDAVLSALSNTPAFLHGHPDWLIQQLQCDWPDDWQTILTANDTQAPMSLRINQQQITAADYRTHLQAAGIMGDALPYAPNGVVLKTPCDVHELPGFESGQVSVQDEAAQLAVTLLQLKPGLRVLDACCAPGGKTAHILETEQTLNACHALDIEPLRMARVQDNLNRLKLQATLITGDALDPPSWWDGLPFDRILLDAPCSATGVIRRHPDIKWLRTKEAITAVAKTQRALLQALWPLLAPGGILVYATCSIMPIENEQQIADFTAEQPNCQVLLDDKPWGRATKHGRQLLPGMHNMDGFFYSVMQKKDVL